MPPYVHTPSIHLEPPYVQGVLIGYLFCYIIKCFPTLEAVMGVVRLKGCPYASCIFGCPICLDTPICSDIPNVWGHLNIREAPKHMGAVKIRGCPNIWGHPNTLGIWTSPKSDNPHDYL